jgi:hypothetical protein
LKPISPGPTVAHVATNIVIPKLIVLKENVEAHKLIIAITMQMMINFCVEIFLRSHLANHPPKTVATVLIKKR